MANRPPLPLPVRPPGCVPLNHPGIFESKPVFAVRPVRRPETIQAFYRVVSVVPCGEIATLHTYKIEIVCSHFVHRRDIAQAVQRGLLPLCEICELPIQEE